MTLYRNWIIGILIIWTTLWGSLHAQFEWGIQHYKVTDGLGSLEVFQSIEDQKGQLWVATSNGICRFINGQFINETSHMTIPSSTFVSLDMLPNGTLVAMNFGHCPVFLYPNKAFKQVPFGDLYRYSSKFKYWKDDLYVGSNSNIFIARIEADSSQFEILQSLDGDYKDIFPYRDAIYILGRNEIVKWQPKINRLDTIAQDYIVSERFTKIDNLLLWETSKGWRQLDITGISNPSAVPIDPSVCFSCGLLSDLRRSIQEDFPTGAFSTVSNQLNISHIYPVQKTSNDAFWVSTYGGGLFYLRLNRGLLYRSQVEEPVRRLFWDKAGLYYLFLDGIGHILSDEMKISKESNEKILNIERSQISRKFFESDPRVRQWFGHHPNISFEIVKPHYIDNYYIDGDRLYIAYRFYGIECISGTGLLEPNIAIPQRISGIEKFGEYIVVAAENKLTFLVDSKIAKVIYLNDNMPGEIYDIKKGKEELLVATSRGLYSINNQLNIASIEDLSGMNIKTLAIDLDSNFVWLGTYSGLARWNRKKIQFLGQFTKELAHETKTIQINNGQIATGTNSGLFVHDIRVLNQYLGAQPCQFSTFKLENNDRFVESTYTLKIPYKSLASGIRLQYDLVCNEWINKSDVWYRMDQGDWTSIANPSNTFKLPIFKSGKYILEIKTTAANGNEWIYPQVITIEIDPPFLKSIPFFLLMTLLIGGLGMYGYKNWLKARYSRQLAKLEEDYYKELMEQKYQAALMNPHLIINLLSITQSELLKNRSKGIKDLGKFAGFINNIFQYLRKGKIKLHHEIEFLKAYLEVVAAYVQDFKVKVVIDPFLEKELSQWSLDPMLLQPIVENAIIHGLHPSDKTPRRLYLSIKWIGNGLIKVIIMDNGVGLSSTNGTSRSGSIIRKRLQYLQAKYHNDITWVLQDRSQLEPRLSGAINCLILPVYRQD